MQSGNNNTQRDATAATTISTSTLVQNGPASSLPIMPFQPGSVAAAQAAAEQSRASPHPPQVFIRGSPADPTRPAYLPAIASAGPADSNIDPAIAGAGGYRYDNYLASAAIPVYGGQLAAGESPDSNNSQDHDHHPGNPDDSEWKPDKQSNRPRKQRREKPRIELAADQPPTTQGKPRARVYVACAQCRGRKIRCDGAKPICHNCSRRTNGAQECAYDHQPKRRGPDKVPGARQRMAREQRPYIDGGDNADYGTPRRRRKRTDNDLDDPHHMSPGPNGQPQPPPNVASMYPPDPTHQAYLQQRPGDLPGPPGFVGDRSAMGFHGPGPDQLASGPPLYPPARRLEDGPA